MKAEKQIKIGAILSYLSIGINIIAGLIYTPWMVDTIGESNYGLYTLSNSLITLFLVDFGLSSAVSRYVAKYRAEGRQDKVDNFLGAVYKLYLIIDAVIFVALVIIYFCIDSIYVKLTPAELEKFKVVYLISASFAVINFPFVTFNGILNSYEKFIPLKLADVIYRILLVALTVITLLLGGGLYGLVAVHAIVGLIVIAYKWIVIKKQITLKINWKYSDFSLYKDIFGFSIWVTISSLAQRLVFNITPSILGAVASSAAIAVFGIVTTIEGYTYTITTAINGMFMSKISRIYECGGEKDELMPLMLSVGKFQYAINGLIVVGFAVVGKEFINLWMGPTYLDAYYTFYSDDDKYCGEIPHFFQYVKPENPLSEACEYLTCITNKMLENERTIDTVLSEFINFVGNLPIATSNKQFDISFINVALKKLGRLLFKGDKERGL